jgi:hypothetical protein
MNSSKILMPALLLGAVLSTVSLRAQVPAAAVLKAVSVGPYAEMAYPTGKMADMRNNGFGFGVAADIRLPIPVGLTGSAGFMSFGGKDIPDMPSARYETLQGFPLRIGVKWSRGPIYTVLETGSVSVSKGGSGTTALFAPGIGLRILKIDVRAKYETWFRSGEAQFFSVMGSLRF